MTAYDEYLKLVDDEYKFLGNLGVLLRRTLAANNQQVINLVRNRRQLLKRLHGEVESKAQKQQQQQHQQGQEKKFQDAEVAKSGGPRRPS